MKLERRSGNNYGVFDILKAVNILMDRSAVLEDPLSTDRQDAENVLDNNIKKAISLLNMCVKGHYTKAEKEKAIEGLKYIYKNKGENPFEDVLIEGQKVEDFINELEEFSKIDQDRETGREGLVNKAMTLWGRISRK